MTVENDTACWYQYIDMTPQSEALYEFVTKTIEEALVEELSFLANYDNTKKVIQNIIDMPDRSFYPVVSAEQRQPFSKEEIRSL